MKKESPLVVILAAGMGKRFDLSSRNLPKSLLKIYKDYSIFDFLIGGLFQNNVSELHVILGYKSNEFHEYFHTYTSNEINIIPIQANENYTQGPVFTLLSIIPYLHDVKNIIVLPSDTIFHPSILAQIFEQYDDEHQDACQMFYLNLSEAQLNQYNRFVPFSPYRINKSSPFHQLLLTRKNANENVLIPVLKLSRVFLNYVNSPKKRLSGKIIQNLEKYCSLSRNCILTQITYDHSLPPFIDIDNPEIYAALNSVKDIIKYLPTNINR